MNIISRYESLTKDERKLLVNTLNWVRLYGEGKENEQFKRLPEIHDGNLIFVSWEKIQFILTQWAHGGDLPFVEYRPVQLGLLKKWGLKPAEWVIDYSQWREHWPQP